ncbi:hypothetical protein Bca52824_008864 [Brassica carinata]|uniref:Uncharacterized protein n=1 Tax=Brassica carinata TaxID=52824 RepID=A0A8X7W9W5_BRACI|nr:hypothetical protein Bca52824_008864 [Brassica carinata]
MAVCGQLAQTFTSDTFSTVLILALLCFGECLSLVLSRVSLLGFSPPTRRRLLTIWLFLFGSQRNRSEVVLSGCHSALVSPFGLVHFRDHFSSMSSCGGALDFQLGVEAG